MGKQGGPEAGRNICECVRKGSSVRAGLPVGISQESSSYLRSIGILSLLVLPLPIPVLPIDDVEAHFGSARFGVDEGKLICLLLLGKVYRSDFARLASAKSDANETLTFLLLPTRAISILHSSSDCRGRGIWTVRKNNVQLEKEWF